MANSNFRKAKTIEYKNKKRLLEVNPKLNDKPGIYFFLRINEDGFKFAYIGQAKSVIQRCCSHMVGYQQHIDLSLKRHKLYSEHNPYGWRVEFLNFPESQLDDKEKEFIKKYADAGYQLRNVSVGGQGSNRDAGQIGEHKQAKGYYDGLAQGRKNLAKELSHIIDKHLIVSLKPEKSNNKVSQKALEKFNGLLEIEEVEGE